MCEGGKYEMGVKREMDMMRSKVNEEKKGSCEKDRVRREGKEFNKIVG